jgi:tripartite-type tricarboxylate transporter receptor subunit TctC
MRIAKGLTIIVPTLFAAAAPALAADAFPNHPVRVVVPFAAGGATDIVTRLVGQKLNEIWGQTVVVDNRAGAGGNIGADLVAKSAPDGYAILMTSGSIVTANPYIYKRMPFDPEKDLAPISNVASGPQLLVVNPASPWKSVKDLIAAAKAKPKAITFGSAGFGTQTHLAAENFIYTSGIDVVHIPYKGEAPAITDLMGGQVQFVTPNLSAAIGFVQQGKLRALGVTSPKRIKQLPDVPAVAETLPGFENLGWFGFMAPAGTPRAIITKIQQDTAKAVQGADVKARLDQLGMYPTPNTPEQFAKDIKEESKHWQKIVRERKLVIE